MLQQNSCKLKLKQVVGELAGQDHEQIHVDGSVGLIELGGLE